APRRRRRAGSPLHRARADCRLPGVGPLAGRGARGLRPRRRSRMNSAEAHPEIARGVLDEELSFSDRDAEDEAYRQNLARLSHASVVKHFDAYADVDWDAPEMRIDPADPRWELDDDALVRTAWYQAQPPDVRSAIGLAMIASFMKL